MSKKWIVMVYMAGDNNLSDEMIGALQRIRGKPINPQLTGVVLCDTVGRLLQGVLDELEASKDGSLFLRDAPFTRFDPNGKDLGVAHVLREFIGHTMSSYPAENSMLVLNGHGSGAVGDFL